MAYEARITINAIRVFIDNNKISFFQWRVILIIDNFIYEYYELLFIVFMIGFTVAGAQNGLNLISELCIQPMREQQVSVGLWRVDALDQL